MLIIDYLRSGGPVMIPILLASVVGVATVLERLWSLRRARVLPVSFTAELSELVRQQRWGDALAACRKRELPAARLAELAFVYRHESRAQIKERMEEVGRREIADMERGVAVIGTIASVATLLGLLGTTGGMIVTFGVVSEQGQPEIRDLAGGLSQALVTTFSGLCVAIPAVLANRWLLARVDTLAVDLEEFCLRLLDQIREVTPSSEAAK